MQQHVVKNTGQNPWRRNWDDGSVSAVLLTTLWLRCSVFLHLISSQIASFAWVLSSLNSTKHFERPGQRLLLFPGRGQTTLAASHLWSLMYTSSIPHSVFSSISERWRFSSLKVSSWTRITWGDRGKKQAQKKEHMCPQQPTSIFHPEFKKSKFGAISCAGTL